MVVEKKIPYGPHHGARSDGTILSYDYNGTGETRALVANRNKNGYMSVSFSSKKPVKRHYVHRIVAELFVPNPDNKPQVNHKDGQRDNNNYKNLEWVTPSENNQHGWNNGRVAYQEPWVLCKKGHSKSGDNLYVSPGGAHRCRSCDKRSRKSRYAKMGK